MINFHKKHNLIFDEFRILDLETIYKIRIESWLWKNSQKQWIVFNNLLNIHRMTTFTKYNSLYLEIPLHNPQFLYRYWMIDKANQKRKEKTYPYITFIVPSIIIQVQFLSLCFSVMYYYNIVYFRKFMFIQLKLWGLDKHTIWWETSKMF